MVIIIVVILVIITVAIIIFKLRKGATVAAAPVAEATAEPVAQTASPNPPITDPSPASLPPPSQEKAPPDLEIGPEASGHKGQAKLATEAAKVSGVPGNVPAVEAPKGDEHKPQQPADSGVQPLPSQDPPIAPPPTAEEKPKDAIQTDQRMEAEKKEAVVGERPPPPPAEGTQPTDIKVGEQAALNASDFSSESKGTQESSSANLNTAAMEATTSESSQPSAKLLDAKNAHPEDGAMNGKVQSPAPSHCTVDRLCELHKGQKEIDPDQVINDTELRIPKETYTQQTASVYSETGKPLSPEDAAELFDILSTENIPEEFDTKDEIVTQKTASLILDTAILDPTIEGTQSQRIDGDPVNNGLNGGKPGETAPGMKNGKENGNNGKMVEAVNGKKNPYDGIKMTSRELKELLTDDINSRNYLAKRELLHTLGEKARLKTAQEVSERSPEATGSESSESPAAADGKIGGQ